MPKIILYRENRELMGKELSANTLASFIVAQRVASVAQLRTDLEMLGDMLRFINRDRAIQYWCDQGWLTRNGSDFRLTNEGIEEVANREAGTSLNANGRKKPGNIDPERIQLARQFILNGGSAGQSIQQEFDID